MLRPLFWSSRKVLHVTLVLALALFGCVVLLTLFTQTSTRHPSYNPKKIQLVISHYTEDGRGIAKIVSMIRQHPLVQELGLYAIVYTKNPNAASILFRAELLKATGADEVIDLPNLGREGGTYLDHMIRTYHNPSSLTIYIQADTRPEPYLTNRLSHQLTRNTGFLTLSSPKNIDSCRCYHCDPWEGFYPRLADIAARLGQPFCVDTPQTVSYNGMFVLSGRRLRHNPLAFYVWLRDLVHAPADAPVHEDLYPIGLVPKSIPSNPLFGHTLERAWHMIGACQSESLGKMCRYGGACGCDD